MSDCSKRVESVTINEETRHLKMAGFRIGNDADLFHKRMKAAHDKQKIPQAREAVKPRFWLRCAMPQKRRRPLDMIQ